MLCQAETCQRGKDRVDQHGPERQYAMEEAVSRDPRIRESGYRGSFVVLTLCVSSPNARLDRSSKSVARPFVGGTGREM